MPKTQGFLPVYDRETKRLLGGYLLPYSKTFNGDEKTHNVAAPAAPDAKNTVNIAKIESPFKVGKVNDWFMAAVFTHDEIRLKHYEGYPNFKRIEDVAPGYDWLAPASAAHGIKREFDGLLIAGMRGEAGWQTGAMNLKPANTVAPTITGTMAAGQSLAINQGSWTEDGGRVVTYQWKLDGVAVATTATYTVPAASVGKVVTCDVTHSFGGESTKVTTAGRAITA